MIFICKCGCELQKEELKVAGSYVSTNGRKRRSTKLACPVHKEEGFIEKRRVFCAEEGCTGYRDVGAYGSPPQELCAAHFQESQNQKQKLWQSNYTVKQDTSERAKLWRAFRTQFDSFRDSDKWDCANRDDCLVVYDRFSCMPCGVCDFYNPERLQKEELLLDPGYSVIKGHVIA